MTDILCLVIYLGGSNIAELNDQMSEKCKPIMSLHETFYTKTNSLPFYKELSLHITNPNSSNSLRCSSHVVRI